MEKRNYSQVFIEIAGQIVDLEYYNNFIKEDN